MVTAGEADAYQRAFRVRRSLYPFLDATTKLEPVTRANGWWRSTFIQSKAADVTKRNPGLYE